jgi:O-antigen/teichoic acid export membrane protein
MLKRLESLRGKGMLQSFSMVFGSSMVRSVGAALGFAATFLATAVLGPHNAGVLFGSYAWATGLAILVRWGISDRLILEVPPLMGTWREQAIPGIVNRDLWACAKRSVLITALVVVAWELAGLFGISGGLSLTYIVLALPATVLMQVLSTAGKAVGGVAASIAFEFLAPPLLVIIFSGVVRFGVLPATVGLIGSGYIVGSLLGALGCYAVSMHRRWHRRRLRGARRAVRRRDTNFAVIEISNYLNSWLSMLMLPFLMSSFDVGLFNMAFRLTAAIGLISSTIYIILMPRLAIAMQRGDRGMWRATIIQGRAIMALLGIGFMAGIWLLGPSVLGWAGQEFLAAKRALLIMTAGFSLSVALGPSGGVLAAAGQEKVVRDANMASTALALLLLVPAVEFFGLDGAAFVAACATFSLKAILLVAEMRLHARIERMGSTTLFATAKTV